MKPRTMLILLVLLVVPMVICILWLVSGRELLTGYGRVVPVESEDIFGDKFTHDEMVPGPIFGYYIGLSWVVLSSAAWLAIAVACWLLTRWKRLRLRRNQPAAEMGGRQPNGRGGAKANVARRAAY